MKRRHFVPSSLSGVRIETRAAEGGGQKQVIVGYASVFGVWTELYRGRDFCIREMVRVGAYTHALAERQDVRALFNHDANIVLGRTSSGTLRLSEDATGLINEIDYPDTPTVRDLVITPMERGDITGQSFAFVPRSGGYRLSEYERDGVYYHDYELQDANLYDVSVVTYPQYTEASASLRSADSVATAIRALGLDQVESSRSADDVSTPPPATPPAVAVDQARRAARARFLSLAEIG
jgi:HK97 family phage prohead protease